VRRKLIFPGAAGQVTVLTEFRVHFTTQVPACKAAILEIGSNAHLISSTTCYHISSLHTHPKILAANEKFSTPVNARLTFIHKIPKTP
jgi:hypothetical protein